MFQIVLFVGKSNTNSTAPITATTIGPFENIRLAEIAAENLKGKQYVRNLEIVALGKI